MTVFLKFSPIYTILCLLIFFALKLYNGLWKYAGLNDFNRILIASLITTVFQILGTLLFFERMPFTYYILGAFIQLAMLLLSRFAYRIWYVEKKVIASRRQTAKNVMIIGASETGRNVVKYLQNDLMLSSKPACIIDTWEHDRGRTMEGVPVIGGIDNLKAAIEKYSIDEIIFADPLLDPDNRMFINQIAKESKIETQNYNASFLDKNSQEKNNYSSSDFRSLHHIAIIVSTEKSIGFYQKLGFHEIDRMDRGYDIIVMMEGPCLLEIYIDPTHPARVNRPEALGLRHLALKVDDLSRIIDKLDIEVEPIRQAGGKHFTYLKDPDGLPIELHE